jgi:hypothetical protein
MWIKKNCWHIKVGQKLGFNMSIHLFFSNVYSTKKQLVWSTEIWAKTTTDTAAMPTILVILPTENHDQPVGSGFLTNPCPTNGCSHDEAS